MDHIIKKISLFCILLLVVLGLKGCVEEKDKSHYIGDMSVCGNISAKLYTVFGSGAFGGDLISKYLTDKKNFQKYIGTFDSSNENISCKCKDGLIIVKHYKDDYSSGKWKAKTIKLDTLIVSELIKEKKFD